METAAVNAAAVGNATAAMLTAARPDNSTSHAQATTKAKESTRENLQKFKKKKTVEISSFDLVERICLGLHVR